MRSDRPNRPDIPGALRSEERMAGIWQRLSDRHFRGKLYRAPAIRVAPPVVSGAYASFIAYPDGHSEVAVDPQLFLGHPDIDGSAPAAGKWRFIEDLLLHEAIHDVVHRLGRDDEPHHGGAFAILAAGIGRDLELCFPPDNDWQNWPYDVRPADYYLGAFRPHAPHTGEVQHGTAQTKVTDRPRKRNQARRTTSPAAARDPWPCPTSRYP